MTNAFSRDYQPHPLMQKGWEEDRKAAEVSRRFKASRAKRMASDDPAVREAARGDLGPLSAKKGRVK